MKRRRLVYVPGLISLIGLPILLLIRGPGDPVEQVTMRVRLPSEQKSSAGVLAFNREGVQQLLKHKKIVPLSFYYRPSRLHPEYNYYRRSAFLLQEMARQQFLNDTTEVLKVHFEDCNDYGDLVWMLNNAIVFFYKRYVYMDDDLYLFANPPPPPPSTLSIEPLVSSDDVVAEAKPWAPPTSWDLLWERLSWKWREFVWGARRNYWLCIGFVLLIVAPWGLYMKGGIPA